ncbi:hypothetical protein HAX54_049798 [Datura stramonium]|uniref:Uncharacterized protein n=1 Tax=Datura stramonium TaxID=4076 RepID=A0ABS8WPN2_DATST|nr:hypothetical protein [Datura stramonium]
MGLPTNPSLTFDCQLDRLNNPSTTPPHSPSSTFILAQDGVLSICPQLHSNDQQPRGIGHDSKSTRLGQDYEIKGVLGDEGLQSIEFHDSGAEHEHTSRISFYTLLYWCHSSSLISLTYQNGPSGIYEPYDGHACPPKPNSDSILCLLMVDI